MKYLQNLHTHSTYCDGIDTPEQMIAHAMEKGFDSLGFSGHSFFQESEYCVNVGITEESTKQYREKIRQLQEQYRGTFPLFLGLEVEYYSDTDLSGYDYLIGSVHYLKKDGQYLDFDLHGEVVKNLIDEHFGGDGLAFAKMYYETLAQLPQRGAFDIIGHFDLVSKNLEKMALFDDTCKQYLDYAFEAARALQGKIPFFEVNTGAMARGYRTTPYPSIPILKELKRLGFSAIISSDCHDGRKLDCGFEQARELLLRCGFKEKYILTDSGFRAVEL